MTLIQHPAFRLGAAFIIILLFRVQPDWLPVLDDLRRAGASSSLTDDAYLALQDAFVRQPWNTQFAVSAGLAAVAVGDYEAAKTAIDTAAAHAGWTPELHIALGDAHIGAGEVEKAIHEWETARPDRLTDVALLTRLARAYEATGRYALAAVTLRALVDLQPENAIVRYRYGVVLSVIDPPAAPQHLALAAGLDESVEPFAESLNEAVEAGLMQNDRAYRMGVIGQALIGLSEFPLAKAALTQAVEERPDFADAYVFLGLAEDHLGNDGLSHYQKALALDDQLPFAYYLIGLNYRRKGQDDQAITALQKAFELDPSNAAAAAELGSAYVQKVDLPAAERWYRQAVQIEPENASFWMLLAKFYTENEIKVEEDGLLSAQRAVALAPDSAEALDTLGFAHYLSGGYDEAELNLSKAISLAPDLASANFHIGLVYLETNRPEQARETLTRAVNLGAGGPVAEQAFKALARLGITSLPTPSP